MWVLASLLCAGSSAAQQEEKTRYYGALHAGRHNIDAWTGQVSLSGSVTAPASISADPQAVVGVVVGRQRDRVRYEFEYQQGRFDLTTGRAGTLVRRVAGLGDYRALTFSVYRHGPLQDSVSWNGYAGLGIGYGHASLPQALVSAGCQCLAAASGSGLVLLGRVGIEYAVDQDSQVFGQYTLLRMPGPASGTVPGMTYDNKWIGAVTVGYRRFF